MQFFSGSINFQSRVRASNLSLESAIKNAAFFCLVLGPNLSDLPSPMGGCLTKIAHFRARKSELFYFIVAH
jgi:hypothetical protein